MLKMILVFLKIGLASYGGGWTIVGVIQSEIVGRGWMSVDEFSQLIAMAQITPGPVALNSATLVGYKLYGLSGAALATLAVVTVPVMLSAVLCFAASKLEKHSAAISEALKTGTIGLIAMTVWTFMPAAYASYRAAAFSIAAFVILAFTKVNPLWVIFGAGVLGGFLRLASSAL